MQKGEWSQVTAIASRDRGKAEKAAGLLGIPKAYGSYAELLSDPDIDAIYNPLPNHLHVPWTIVAAEKGKHVLCEKPLATTVADAEKVRAVRERTGVKIGEAFMVRTHPRWIRTRELIRSGRIGELRTIESFFSYFDREPKNVRNVLEYGGGALLEIGCYPITLSRFLYGEEPIRMIGLLERDPDLKIDRLDSAILDFPSGRCAFTCGTQFVYHQRMHFQGTRGRIEISVPLNPPIDRPSQILIDDGRDLSGGGVTVETIPACDQFTIQADLFSKAIRGGEEVPVSVEDATLNASVIEAIFRSAESCKWERPARPEF